MPLIETATLLKIADRAAYQYNQIRNVLDAVKAEGDGYYFDIVTATGDPDVEIPLVGPYRGVDTDFLIRDAIRGIRLPDVIAAMAGHFSRPDPSGEALQIGGWDGYLQEKGVLASQYFGQLFYDMYGFYMRAVNIFSEGDDLFATAEVIAGPDVDFTDGVNYGDGSVNNPADGDYFAATKLRVVVVAMGVNDLTLTLNVKNATDDIRSAEVVVPGGSAPGDEIAVVDEDVNDRFLDVTGIVLKSGGAGGTVGDTVEVRNVKERQISL